MAEAVGQRQRHLRSLRDCRDMLAELSDSKLIKRYQLDRAGMIYVTHMQGFLGKVNSTRGLRGGQCQLDATLRVTVVTPVKSGFRPLPGRQSTYNRKLLAPKILVLPNLSGDRLYRGGKSHLQGDSYQSVSGGS
ncbi:hypothetical protein E2C01_048144 [Portunus trituberculatus]|uniref:Uncharacterized protein n=1 Tax=Portunus trituberculatus TaxID=210409 RepID=A0A5B7GCG0_PORTR|nr:hypothetical protein [Portunus trituberculatus]